MSVGLSHIKLAMLDVDGTLRHGDAWMPGADELLQLCRDRGWQIALCSGRPADSLMDLAADAEANMGIRADAIASGNGTAIWERAGDGWQQRHSRAMPAAAVEPLVQWARDNGMGCWGYTADRWLSQVDDALTRRLAEFMGVEPVVGRFAGRDDIMKLEFVAAHYGQFFGREVERLPVPVDLLEPYGLAAVASVPGSTDVVLDVAAQTKGGDLLTADRGLTWSDVFAVGNGGNDLGMIARAALGAVLPPLTAADADDVGARFCTGPDAVAAWLRDA